MQEQETSQLENVVSHIKDYFQTNFDIIKLTLIEKTVTIVAGAVCNAIMAIIFLLALIMASIGLGIYISRELNNPYMGFLIISGLYIAIALILLISKKALIHTPVSNLLIKKLLKNNKYE